MEFFMPSKFCKSNTFFAALFLAYSGAAMSSGHPMAFLHADGHAAQSITPKIMKVEQTEPVAIDLPDELNKIRGSLEIGESVKYYSFTAIRGQKVMIREIRYNDQQSPWKIEYKVDQHWTIVTPGKSEITDTLIPNQQVQVRISNDPGKPVPPGTPYELQISSAPYLVNHRVIGDADRYAIHFPVYKFVNTFEWFTHVRDSTGHPLKGVTIELRMDIDDKSPFGGQVYRKDSNHGGAMLTNITLPACVGRYTTTPFVGVFDFRTKWQLTYNTGNWYMSPEGHEEGGVGRRYGDRVPLVHICTQKIVGEYVAKLTMLTESHSSAWSAPVLSKTREIPCKFSIHSVNCTIDETDQRPGILDSV
jgi:hypothetical protein